MKSNHLDTAPAHFPELMKDAERLAQKYLSEYSIKTYNIIVFHIAQTLKLDILSEVRVNHPKTKPSRPSIFSGNKEPFEKE